MTFSISDLIKTERKHEICAVYKEKGGLFTELDLKLMSEAIFLVENDIEHLAVIGVENPKKILLRKQAKMLNQIRNEILLEIGENENQ